MNVDFNTDAERIEIPLSKFKIGLILLGASGFVALGIWFIINPAMFQNSGYVNRPAFEILAAGYASIIFFGACAIFAAYKIFDNKSGLIIDKDGITDNSSGVSVGFIPWGDITHLDIKQVYRQKFILVFVNDAQKYINKQSFFKNKAILGNYKFYGTPVTITSNGLKCNFDDLYNLLSTKLEKYNKHLTKVTSIKVS